MLRDISFLLFRRSPVEERYQFLANTANRHETGSQKQCHPTEPGRKVLDWREGRRERPRDGTMGQARLGAQTAAAGYSGGRRSFRVRATAGVSDLVEADESERNRGSRLVGDEGASEDRTSAKLFCRYVN